MAVAPAILIFHQVGDHSVQQPLAPVGPVHGKAAQRIAEALKDKTVRITAKAGQGGRLFGSVTAKEIAQEIKKQYGFDIDKRKIHLDTDIKAFGGYHIEVKLYNGITAKLAVSVTEAQ